jgi:hypothetical protein
LSVTYLDCQLYLASVSFLQIREILSAIVRFPSLYPPETSAIALTIIMARKAKEENLEDMPTSINPYEVLGVEEKSTADQIKSAYRKQALKHHPGQNDFAVTSVDFVRSNPGVR